MLKGKKILLGVTGGIAAYKSAMLASLLVKEGAEVQVLMTEHAQEFIAPLTFEALTGRRCVTDTFDPGNASATEHIELAKWADTAIIAPATANVIAKLAHGIADDMLTSTMIAYDGPKIVAPAMNTKMFFNPATQANLETIKSYGMTIAGPASGRLACGDAGAGKMLEPADLLQYVEMACAYEKDLAGKHVLVTAGPTREDMDPVRFITNHSSGKMGYSIAKIAALRGADVTLVSGKTSLTPPLFVTTVPILSAEDMFREVTSRGPEMDIIIKAAAVADYRPKDASDRKMKKKDGDLFIEMERTKDILAYLGAHKREGQYLCGFAMETEDLIVNAQEKLQKKNADMIVANSIRTEGAGFEGDTNVVTFITKGGVEELPLMYKDEVADQIFDRILAEEPDL